MVDIAITCRDRSVVLLFVVPPPKLKTQKKALDGMKHTSKKSLNPQILKRRRYVAVPKILEMKPQFLRFQKSSNPRGRSWVELF